MESTAQPTSDSIRALNERIQQASAFVDLIDREMDKVIVGQQDMVQKLLVALLADGHILLEGVPGLAKTMAIRSLARTVDVGFSRIQFTPDLLPADLIGTLIYSQRTEVVTVEKGRCSATQPGRRDQPRTGQGAERAAGGHAGTAGHHRAGNTSPPRPFPGDGHHEPH